MKMEKVLATTVSITAVLAMTTGTWAQNDLDALYEAAKAEGMLTTIALPHDWCGWGDIIAAFKAKYPGIEVNELNPDAGSADEIEAIKANQGNTGPQAPDVIDVGLAFGPSATAEGLLAAVQVSTFDGIEVKDPTATGTAAITASWPSSEYRLVDNVPQDWADLLNDEYANAVALAGDPRASAQAILGVYAAGLSASGGMPQRRPPPVSVLQAAQRQGNFVPVIGKASSIAQGTTPIIVRWDYNALADRDTLAGNPPIEVVVPETGVIAGVRPGDQRLRAASQCRQALARIHLLRRGPARLPQRLLPPGAVQRAGRRRQGAAGGARQAPAGRRLREGRVPDPRRAEREPRGRDHAVGQRRRANVAD